MTSPPPGRPGNLTAEQEARLREFWGALLKVFGVFGDPNSVEVNGLDADEHTANGVDVDGASQKDSSPEKKKKKHLGIFKKSRKDNDATAPASAAVVAPSASAEADDKYGQTKQFKQALASQTPEDLRKTFWNMVKHDNPDALLLRFLRARKWDVEKALVMLVSTMHWRAQEVHVDDDIMRVGDGGALDASRTGDSAAKKEAEDFLAQMRMGKSYLHGVDKEGRPICFVRVRLHRQGEQSETSLERYTVYVIETARYMLTGSVDTATIIYDMTDFSMANMDYAPVKFMIKCFEANYPESLGVILVHKAPWIFQGIWNIIKGWLDPVVAKKVHFTKTVEDLETYIPRSRIMKELGGEEDWSYQYIEPQPGENARMSDEATKAQLVSIRDDIVKRYEQATLRWLDESRVQANGNGSHSGPETTTTTLTPATATGLTKQRATLAEELRLNSWKIDPYLRARTHYDRIGAIKEGGRLDFYPEKSTPPAAQPGRGMTNETSPDDVD